MRDTKLYTTNLIEKGHHKMKEREKKKKRVKLKHLCTIDKAQNSLTHLHNEKENIMHGHSQFD